MTLPADVARCPGYQADGEWSDGCEDCLRRTAAPVDHQRVVRSFHARTNGRNGNDWREAVRWASAITSRPVQHVLDLLRSALSLALLERMGVVS